MVATRVSRTPLWMGLHKSTPLVSGFLSPANSGEQYLKFEILFYFGDSFKIFGVPHEKGD